MKGFNVFGIVGAIVGTLAFPAHGFAAQWVPNVTPTEAIIGRTSVGAFVQILTSGTIVNPAGCSSADSYMIYDTELVHGALAISLTAVASARQIRLYVTDSCDTATGRPVVSAIGLM